MTGGRSAGSRCIRATTAPAVVWRWLSWTQRGSTATKTSPIFLCLSAEKNTAERAEEVAENAEEF